MVYYYPYERRNSMLTRRQKNSIRGFTAVLSCSALLSGFLIYTNIMNTSTPEPVVISDILEGAVAYADESEDSIPAVTLASDELLETMYAEQEDAAVPSAMTSEDARVPDVTVSFRDEPENYDRSNTDNSETFGNLNEVTLLSDELESFRTNGTGTAPDTLTAPPDSASPDETTFPTLTYFITGTTTARSTVSHTTAPTYSYTVPSTAPLTSASSTTSTPVSTTTSASTTAKTTTTKATTSATTKATTAKTTAATTSGTSKTPFINVGGGTYSTDDSIYLKLFELVNEARVKAGVGKLWYSARVNDVCKIRTDEITSYYSHTRPDGSRFSTAFRDVGIKYVKCGENIAYGLNMFDTPEEVFQAWMDSESHRENILSPDYECCAFGLSILKVGNDTYYYWSQEFAKL